jgi:hypothetical protein
MAEPHLPEGLKGAFGHDSFGRSAERFGRFVGTPKFIVKARGLERPANNSSWMNTTR